MAKRFYEQASYDFTIMDGNETVGHLRVKPNAILWKPRYHQRFYRVLIEELDAHAREIDHVVQQ